MNQLNQLKTGGEKENHLLQIRLTCTQKERLRMLAESSGFKTVSSFVRSQCLNPSMELKINEILLILKNKKEEKLR